MQTVRNLLRNIVRFFNGNPAGIIGATIVALILVACLAAPVLTDKQPNKRVARGNPQCIEAAPRNSEACSSRPGSRP